MTSAVPPPSGDADRMARAICLRQLESGPRTRAQLASLMARRDVPADSAERVLDRLADVGLIDDAAFAQAWVSSRHAGRGLGRRVLARELAQRGIAEDDAAIALDQLDPQEETETARRWAERKARATRGLSPEVRLRRITALLARKGYPAALCIQLAATVTGADATAVETARAATAPDTTEAEAVDEPSEPSDWEP